MRTDAKRVMRRAAPPRQDEQRKPGANDYLEMMALELADLFEPVVRPIGDVFATPGNGSLDLYLRSREHKIELTSDPAVGRKRLANCLRARASELIDAAEAIEEAKLPAFNYGLAFVTRRPRKKCDVFPGVWSILGACIEAESWNRDEGLEVVLLSPGHEMSPASARAKGGDA